jgi:hypothetical protein
MSKFRWQKTCTFCVPKVIQQNCHMMFELFVLYKIYQIVFVGSSECFLFNVDSVATHGYCTIIFKEIVSPFTI